MRDEQPRYAEHQVSTFGVNPAVVTSHEKYAEGFQFNFPLLSDADRNAARAYHALKPDGKGILRTVYLIGKDGRVLFSQRGAPSAGDILAPLKGAT